MYIYNRSPPQFAHIYIKITLAAKMYFHQISLWSEKISVILSFVSMIFFNYIFLGRGIVTFCCALCCCSYIVSPQGVSVMYLSMFLRVVWLLLALVKLPISLDTWTKQSAKKRNEYIYLGMLCITEDLCTKKNTKSHHAIDSSSVSSDDQLRTGWTSNPSL